MIHILDLLSHMSEQSGLKLSTLLTICIAESNANPKATTGSYHGLFMLSRDEFNKWYPEAEETSIHDPVANAAAATAMLRNYSDRWRNMYSRWPKPVELYLIHQQGYGGFVAHHDHPGRKAWENMYSTKEGRERGKDWCKRAVWGNLTPEMQVEGSSVEDLTSAKFIELWEDRLNSLLYERVH